jgi:nitrite reductase (NADH) small subunit
MKKVEIGAIGTLAEKLGKCIKIENMELALFRLSNGKIYAIENRCPHKGGDLSQGIVSGEFVFCPLHDWKISIKDGKVQKPDEGCVKTYKVEMDQDKLYVHLEK